MSVHVTAHAGFLSAKRVVIGRLYFDGTIGYVEHKALHDNLVRGEPSIVDCTLDVRRAASWKNVKKAMSMAVQLCELSSETFMVLPLPYETPAAGVPDATRVCGS